MKTFTRSVVATLLLASLTAGLSAQMRAGKLGVGVGGSLYMYTGEYSTKTNKMGGGLSVAYSPWKGVGLRSLLGVGQFGYTVTPNTNTSAPLGGPATTTFFSGNIYLTGNILPNGKFSPYVSAGLGYLYFDPRLDDGTPLTGLKATKNDINLLLGGGFDIFFSEFFSVSIGGEYCMANNDKLDGYKKTSANDAYMRFGLDLRYYFFDQAFLTRMLEALKARYE